MRRWVWSRNLVNEEALAHWGLLHQKQKNSVFSIYYETSRLFINTFLTQLQQRYCRVRTYCFFFIFGETAPVGQGHLIQEASRSHTTTRHSRYNSSGWVIIPSQRPLTDNTQHSQQTDNHAPGGIRTHSLNWGAAANLRLRPHGHWIGKEILHFVNLLIMGKWSECLIDIRSLCVPCESTTLVSDENMRKQ